MKLLYLFIFLLLFCGLGYTQNPCPGTPTVDYAGKTYNTVQIGNQCWLKENLDVGTRINGSVNQTNNDAIEKYCYNDDPAKCTTYGGLYQWNEAMQYLTTPGAKGICPSGWHIPTLTEFQTLSTTVGNNGNALKAVGQGTGGGAGTNTSGFSALLAGCRGITNQFINLSNFTNFWISTEYSTSYAYNMSLYYSDNYIDITGYSMGFGYSVRCTKNGATDVNDHSSNSTLPKSIDLFQNYPNPFNPSTKISWQLPVGSPASLKVYDILGREVATLVNEFKLAGKYETEFNAEALPSGVYFYRIQAGSFVETKKMILLK